MLPISYAVIIYWKSIINIKKYETRFYNS